MRRKERPIYDERDSCTQLVSASTQRKNAETLSPSEREEVIRRFSDPLRRQLGIDSPEEEPPLHGNRLRGE
jgi:hypothetical protein